MLDLFKFISQKCLKPEMTAFYTFKQSVCINPLCLQSTVDNPPAPVVAELVHNARDNDVRRFQQLVSDNVGSETGWQAIARMFRLTQSAVQMAGMGTNVAIQIKEMTLNYFEDRFADWIVGQGGWVSRTAV